jgi:ADP-ribose pyrophosphatase
MWKTLSSKIIHKNPWWSLKHDKFELPSGKKGNYYIVHTDGASMVIPLIEGKIILIRQYRYPINAWNWELPAGGVKKGSNYLKTAKEELEEETGFQAKKIKNIGKFYPYMGIGDELCQVFLATELNYVGVKHESTEDIEIKQFAVSKVYEMIDKKIIIDGLTLASLLIARKYLKIL